jgi:AcrR family transcriptional regulator
MARTYSLNRARAVERGAQLASVEGLEGVSIGRLASELAMSKSGLVGLFGSKTELQLAMVEDATRLFRENVVARVTGEPGMPRLEALLRAWVDYLDLFEGGCFFFAAANEFSSRPGPVRDAVAAATRSGIALITQEIRLAQRSGEIDRGVDAEQLAFELHGHVLEANLMRRLLDDKRAYGRARRAIKDRLRQAASV